MPTKVPNLETTKATILNALGADGLREAEAQFNQTYGKSVNDPALRMWLIAKHNGIEVEEIKADSNAAEGEQVAIAEMLDKAKSPEGQGWTHVNGGKFEQPDVQSKYALQGAIMTMEEGTTSTNKTKLDLSITDGTGIAKIVAYGDAVGLFAEAKAKLGSVVRIPLATVQYGRHNFGKEPNMVWWKFAVPPFGQVLSINEDPKNFFLNVDTDDPKEGKAAYILGFITHAEEQEHEVCSICEKWVTNKNTHEACQVEDGFETRTEIEIVGTSTSVNGQTSRLKLPSKPKKLLELVEIYGRINKMGGMDVAFIRKPGAALPDAAPAKAAPKPATPAKAPAKAKVTPAPVQVAAAEEEAAEEEVPAPVQLIKTVKPKIMPKKAAASVPVEEPEEEPAEEAEVEVVTPRAKAAPAKTAKPAAQATTQVEAVEIPEVMVKHIETTVKQFGGKGRPFVLARQAVQKNLLGTGDEVALQAKARSYIDAAIEQGLLEWTTDAKTEVRLTA